MILLALLFFTKDPWNFTAYRDQVIREERHQKFSYVEKNGMRLEMIRVHSGIYTYITLNSGHIYDCSEGILKVDECTESFTPVSLQGGQTFLLPEGVGKKIIAALEEKQKVSLTIGRYGVALPPTKKLKKLRKKL